MISLRMSGGGLAAIAGAALLLATASASAQAGTFVPLPHSVISGLSDVIQAAWTQCWRSLVPAALPSLPARPLGRVRCW